jgi:glycosyltransferase involved in cell wall biosynthesis
MAIRQSGLFLSHWYAGQHGAAIAPGEDGVAHFCQLGWREGARPNPYFDPGWYLARNPDVAAAGVNPLLHYLAMGEAEGRNPSPYFEVSWYRATYGLGPKEACLAHYLARRLSGQVNPVPLFDAAYYLENNADVAAGGADPFEHFLIFGVTEGRNPAADFDVRFYQNRYGELLGGQNPLLHYLAHREDAAFAPKRPEHEELAPGAVRRATRPSPAFEAFAPVPAQAKRKATLLAYYLPQFHAVAENDAWWGKGFTDWTNLGRAMPRFVGHLQPRIPRDLGYYALDNPDTLRRQIEMAKGAGLGGFVFYTYWFNRHRLLEKPLEQLLGDKSLDFPFCAMWANENWTRRWDGLEREVLIAQEYLESDDAALIAHFVRMFDDPRYIRIGGRALLFIYRVTIIPDAARRIAKWRKMFSELHGEEPLLVMAQSLGDYDPEPYGLDGAVEFPPHKLSQETDRINETLDLLDPDFSAIVHDYEEIARTSLALPETGYPLIKTIVPGWDNDPRREGKGLVVHGATPEKYQAWLEKLVGLAEQRPFYGEKLICVNAWNEWAEGAFLEPDLHFGAAFLNATSRAICVREGGEASSGILLVGHDAQPHGAQMLLLHLARRLKRDWGVRVHLLLLGVGPLLGEYYKTAEVSVAQDKTIIGDLLDKYRGMGIRTAIVNSAASARVVPWAERRGIRTTLLVHEMPQLLREHQLEIQARLGGAAAGNLVFSSEFLAEKFCAAVNLTRAERVILPQGNYLATRPDAAARARVRRALGVEEGGFLVLGAGFADFRKGFDLFLQIARKVASGRGDVRFVWVGDMQFVLKTYLGPEMEQASAAGWFLHVPFTEDVAEYFAAADVFALTSREDPFPTVVMEALGCGVPCVAFEGAGGIPDLLRREKAGVVARLGDVDDFGAQVEALLEGKKLARMRGRLSAMAAEKFAFGGYVERLLRLGFPGLRKVSVAVLNYNYARYLPERLESVFAQSYPVAEVLLLDDASGDDSLAVAAQAAEKAGREVRVIANARNSGSVFAQWRRAALAATGEFIWLCEADDAAAPGFLARLMAAMEGCANPLLAFSDSRAVDEDGKQVMASYQSYYFASGVRELAASGLWDGAAFARRILAERNLILNVSAVLWRREALLRALDAVGDIESWQLAGDWRLYLEVLTAQKGELVYLAEALNTHRRHGAGVTQGLSGRAHVAEIVRMQAVAAEKLGLDDAARAAQARYAAQVSEQLGTGKKPVGKVAKKRRV